MNPPEQQQCPSCGAVMELRRVQKWPIVVRVYQCPICAELSRIAENRTR